MANQFARLLSASAVHARRAIHPADRRFHQTWIEFHSKTEPKLLQFVFDLVQRFLAEVPILQHFRFGFLRQLTYARDVRIVQAIGRTYTELDFIDTHVQELFQLYVFFTHASGRFIKLMTSSLKLTKTSR